MHAISEALAVSPLKGLLHLEVKITQNCGSSLPISTENSDSKLTVFPQVLAAMMKSLRPSFIG